MPDLRSPSRTAGIWLLLLFLLAVPAALSAYDAQRDRVPAPPFALVSTGLEDGVMGEPVAFSLEDYRGRTLVLDFMAVSCIPCREVTSDVMRPLHAELGAHPDVAFLSVDTWADPGTSLGFGGETDESLRQLQLDEQAPWRHALDTDEVWRKYSAITLPRVVVVDPDGWIVFDHLGTPSADAVREAILASRAGTAAATDVLQLALPGLAFLAGAASVLSPCTVGLLPAYLGMLVRGEGAPSPGAAAAAGAGTPPGGPTPARVARLRRNPIVGGLAAAAGIVVAYAALAALFALAGRHLQPLLGQAALFVGALFVVVGILAVAGRGLRIQSSRVDGRRGFFLFGIAFGLAGFGCTGPLFLPILLAGFGTSVGAGLVAFGLYALAVALLVVAAAAVVAAGKDGWLRGLARHGAAVGRIAGALMVAAGLWILAKAFR